jgi:[acyl-carrier-protein] S-malonyltransferase
VVTAFLHPGQGSQTPGAGQPWRDHSQWGLIDEMSAATGVDLAHLLLDADEAELRDTAHAQLSTYAISVLIARALAEGGIRPDVVAGHSLGEYTALATAGVLDPIGGARLVAARGAAMREAAAVRPGTMAAILGLEVAEVSAGCADSGGEVWVANDNAPGQVVIAGTVEAVEAAGELLRERGARRPMPLAVAGAFHTPLMAPAQEPLDRALEATVFADPGPVVVWSNVDAAEHREGSHWPTLLSSQLCQPVRWREQILGIAQSGVDRFIEVGPGTVLTGLVKRIAPETPRSSVATPDDLESLLTAG